MYVLSEPGLDQIVDWLGNSADFEEFVDELESELTAAGINLSKYLQIYKSRVFGK